MNLTFAYWTGVIFTWWVIGPIVDRAIEDAMLRNPLAWDLGPFARVIIALIWPSLPVLLILLRVFGLK